MATESTAVEYRWLSDAGSPWTTVANIGDDTDAQALYQFDLRATGSLGGNVQLRASTWPDASVQD